MSQDQSSTPLEKELIRFHADVMGYKGFQPNEATLALAHEAARRLSGMCFDPTEVTRLIVLDVAEIPDRNSPDDWPEAMIVTDAELRRIIHDRLMEALQTARFASSEITASEPAIQAVLKEMAWGQDCRDDAIQLLRAIQNAAPQAMGNTQTEHGSEVSGSPAVAAPSNDKLQSKPDGYAVLLDDKASAPNGFWFVNTYHDQGIAADVAQKQKGARVVPIFFAESIELAPQEKAAVPAGQAPLEQRAGPAALSDKRQQISDIAFERYEAVYNVELHREKDEVLWAFQHEALARRAAYNAVVAECSVPSAKREMTEEQVTAAAKESYRKMNNEPLVQRVGGLDRASYCMGFENGCRYVSQKGSNG